MKKSPVYTVMAMALATALGCASIATDALARGGGGGGGGHGGGGYGGGGHGDGGRSGFYFYPGHSGAGHFGNGFYGHPSYGHRGGHSNRWGNFRDDRWNYDNNDYCWQRQHKHASSGWYWGDVWVCS